MDYDNDDISRHTLQLGSEGKNRSSSAVRQCDFPKFDFDDSLQGHLRFDSLVETEVFLGIPSQEDNQWIEDYSRVSNGMEFNPTPADSCSISRRDNVWSEATSSESVEMLLKSVGQEEMIPAAGIILKTNVCDDQGSSVAHLESGSHLDTRNTETMGPQDEVCKDPSQNKHAEEQLPLVDVSSVNSENTDSRCELAHNMTYDTECARSGMSANENKHETDPADQNLQEPETFDCPQVVMLSTSEGSVQINANVSHVSCNESGQERQISIGTGLEDTVNLGEETRKGCVDIPTMVGTPFVLESSALNGADVSEVSLDCPKPNDSGSILSIKESELIFSEGDEKNISLETSIQTDDREVKALTTSNDVENLVGGCQDGSSVDGSNQQPAKLECLTEHCTSPDRNKDSPMQLIHGKENCESMDVQTSQSQSRNLAEAPLSTIDNNKVLIKSTDIKNDVGESSNTDFLSTDTENHLTGKVEERVIDSALTHEGPDVHLAGDSKQVIEETVAHTGAEVSATGQAIREISEQDGKLPECPGNMGHESAETQINQLGTQSVGEDEMVKADELVDPVKRNDTDTAADLLENEHGKISAIELHNSDDNLEEDGVRKNPDGHFSIRAGSFSAVETAGDSGLDPLAKVAVMKCDEMSSSKSTSDEAINLLSLESTQVAEVDKDSCGSPTIISSSEPSRMETNDLEKAGGSGVTENVTKGTQPISEDVKGKSVSGDDNSFTFKVNAVPDVIQEPEKSWSPFQDAEKSKSTIVTKESVPSCEGKTERSPSPKTPRQSAQKTDVQHLQGTSKGTYERKGRRGSGKGAAKESAKKGSQTKGTNPDNSAGIIDKGLNSSFSTTTSSPYVQFGHMQSYGNVDESSKCSLIGILPASNLPDLNASALNKNTSMSPASRQPFTDLQQVQLRAQIFVYGSLIQGSAPDEACMVSAFGPSDAVRITWEPVWRTAIERVQAQKSSSSFALTPPPSQSGARASDLAVKNSSQSSTVLATPVSKVGGKDIPATMASPMIPLSSPLWSISTPSSKGPVVDIQQTVTPLHSYQTPPVRNFNGHTPWPPQTCFPGPWLASPQNTTLTPSARFQPVTMTETVKLTPVRDISLPPVSGVKHKTSTPAVSSLGPNPMYGGVSQPRDTKTTPLELHSGDSKPRKRKKISVSEPQTLPVVNRNLPATELSPVGASIKSLPFGASVPAVSVPDTAALSTGPSKMCQHDTMKAVACSEETLSHVVEAKTQAESASVLATNAVNHCEEMWAQLAKQKESGLTLEIESKLISAAAAIAAAASVAKAAAAAAKVAFSAALQAKLLADEAFLSSKPGVVISSEEKSSVDVHSIGNATPASILKGEKSSTKSNLILVAAKEAAKRRVEAASAASKQAENLDAIVKAAELASLAVSQAGKIVVMGEPLPLADLIEAGPDGYWKLTKAPTMLTDTLRDENKDQAVTADMKEVNEVNATASGVVSVLKGGPRKRSHFKTRQREELTDLDVRMNFSDGVADSVDTGKKKSRPGIDGKKSIVTTSVSESALRTSTIQDEHENLAGTLPDENIKKGSSVEVLKCGGSLRSAWYPANVLELEDGKAYVCYNDLSSGEGSGNLCEWVHLEGDEEKAPVIRVSHPWNSLQYQGTRKRRRAALRDYAWGVGDKVDVWIDDCWCEGVISEIDVKDETTLKVHFPAQGETSTVRAWNVRTSRSWVDGKWVEWSSWKAQHSLDQNDTPKEKRQKMGSPVVVTKEKDKLIEKKLAIGNPVESNFLPLTISERTFDAGKVTKENSKGGARRPLRSGQQKEGPRVVFGVPKPTGKTRKFMDVGKHFPSSKGDKIKETSDKYLMPQATGSQGWKVPSRNYSREKRTVESRPKVPSTRKSHRTLPQRENFGSRSGSVESGAHLGTDVEDSVSDDVNSSVKLTDHGFSVSDESAEVPLSSLISHSSSAGPKKVLSSSSRSGRLNRGKLAPAAGKLSKIDEGKVFTAGSGKFVDDANEPRRSNRRFQPTHRLLEGLQSSMVIPKLPSVSHDKGQRNPTRNVFSRGK